MNGRASEAMLVVYVPANIICERDMRWSEMVRGVDDVLRSQNTGPEPEVKIAASDSHSSTVKH